MASVVSWSTSESRSIDISSLSPEILLPIFVKLNSEEIVSFRRVSKKWMEVINTNKLLWRSLEWIGKSTESIEKAVDLFDEKSASTLEMISIEEDRDWSKDLQHLVTAVGRSKASLKSISIMTCKSDVIIGQLLELASSSPNLEKLVLWDSDEYWRRSLPLTHLVPNRKRVKTDSSSSRLKVLWLFSIRRDSYERILQLPNLLFQSLISFALFGGRLFKEIRPLLVKFSQTIVYLSLSITAIESRIEQPLFCPNLKILEGTLSPRISLYFDCPNLKRFISLIRRDFGLQGFSSSVEQLWLTSNAQGLADEFWEPLLRSCPKLEVLRLEQFKYRSGKPFQLEALIQVLEKRQEKTNKGDEIQGLHVAPLHKLVLPLNRLSKDQLERARKFAGEVIDIQDFSNFIELEY